jgi:uncharacterized Zn finger protein
VLIQITANQVNSMAPDANSLAAGKKLANTKHWQHIGQNADALWGECQGSALYQIRIALPTFTIQCNCPSRKQPCKHGLGLLLLAANTPEAVPVSEPPEWITTWLAKRTAANKRKETQESPKETSSPTVTTTQRKTAEKRLAQVNKGIELLDLWLNDLVRNGLGNLETQPATFWDKQAAQMVDAQAAGLASYIRRLASIPNASPNWTEKLLAQLGKLALLTQAFHRIEQLESAMQEDIRQLIGWNLKEEEVLANGERITDNWLILGQAVEDIEQRGRAQRTWLLGTTTKHSALLLQFSFAGAPFSVHHPLGICQKAELVYWPSVQPQRALTTAHQEEIKQVPERLPGVETIDAFLDDVATTLSCIPWRERFLCTLCQVTPVYDATTNRWHICDQHGQALPLVKGEHWQLLALSGGAPVDFAGEWDGKALLPLGILVDRSYHTLSYGDNR